MKSILSIFWFSLVSFHLFAQRADSFKKNNEQVVRYLLPNGKTITADKLDSVLKSWNNQAFSMIHYDDRPGLVGLVPQTDVMKKQFEAERMRSTVMLNQPAPDFDLKDIYGRSHRLSELKGKVVVLNFWFTSCAPCREEMPKLDSVKKNSDLTKIVFLGLALDNAVAVRQFLRRHAFDYELLTDAKEVHTAYKVSSCPTSMVIDKNGVIRFIQSSSNNIGEKLSAAIKVQL